MKRENSMVDDTSLAHGIVVILRKCFELSQTEDDAQLLKHADKLLAGIKAGEHEMALRMLAGDAQLQLDGMVNDSTCREVVELARKLVSENSELDATVAAQNMAMSSQHLPRLATTDEIDALSRLFCSARREIRLAESVCSAEERERLMQWFRQKSEASSLWTTDGRNALVILARNPFAIIEEVQYAVVSGNMRGQRIAPSIIQHVQSLECVRTLCAEARNESSRKMLLRCGFVETGETRSDNPLLRWERE
jgi:hypothetical protein